MSVEEVDQTCCDKAECGHVFIACQVYSSEKMS